MCVCAFGRVYVCVSAFGRVCECVCVHLVECVSVCAFGRVCVCVCARVHASQASVLPFLTYSSVDGCLCCFAFRLFWNCCERTFEHSGNKFWFERLFSPELHIPRTRISESHGY